MFRHLQVCLLIAASLAPAAWAADLEIEVRGIKTRTGHINAALFSNAEDFSLDIAFRAMITREGEISTGVFTREEQMPRAPVERVSAAASSRVVQLRMTDLEPGTYALALYQDVNDDGKLATDMHGKPLEPWGLSNNVRLVDQRAPTFDEAKFVLPPEGARIVIDLQ
jgi:uncharacterized protein (DUF2141 family)